MTFIISTLEHVEQNKGHEFASLGGRKSKDATSKKVHHLNFVRDHLVSRAKVEKVVL
jgi:hypothetical protein